MISTYMMPLGMLICDPISDAVRIEWMLIVCYGARHQTF